MQGVEIVGADHAMRAGANGLYGTPVVEDIASYSEGVHGLIRNDKCAA